MKTLCRRIVAVLIAAMMVLSLGVSALAAAEDQTYDRDPSQTEKLITGYNANGKENGVLDLMPSTKATVKEGDKFVVYTFTFIGVQDNAFNRKDAGVNDSAKAFLETVTELIVEDGIKAIGSYAFANMPALEKVTFKGEADLSDHVFLNCPKLKEVTFEKAAVIGEESFYGCESLTKLTFKSDATFEEKALASAESLADISLNDEAKVVGLSDQKDSPYMKNYPVDFIMNGSTLVFYKGNDEEVTIPLNVTKIGDGAFAGKEKLKTVNITKYVDTIGDNAFAGCSSLENVNFATFGSVKNIGSGIFDGTPYYDDFDGDFFTIGNVLIKYLGDDEYVYIPNTVTSIAPDCFMGCYASSDRGDDESKSGYTWVVSSVFVPASVTDLGENCFALREMDDGSYYLPKIYAYTATDAAQALKDAGYDVTEMPKLGDVDGNGRVEAADARLALRLAVRLDTETDPIYVHAADVNGDGKVTPEDARTILRLVVELEAFTAEDLLYMPATKTEILMAYINAVDYAVRYGAGYTKKTSNAVTGSDMCPAASVNFYSTLAKKGESNETKTFAEGSKEAADNLFISSAVSENDIESATCKLDENGKYTINITFKNADDNYGASHIVKVLPAKTRDYFASAFHDKSWWNGSRESNAVTKFDLTYTNGSVSAVVARTTNKLESLKQTVGYHFAVDGRINGLAISSNMWKTGDATLDRVETTEYTQFVYAPIVNDLQ